MDNVGDPDVRKTMQAAGIESGVQEFLSRHQGLQDEQGRQRQVRNGYLPQRRIQAGFGASCRNMTALVFMPAKSAARGCSSIDGEKRLAEVIAGDECKDRILEYARKIAV